MPSGLWTWLRKDQGGPAGNATIDATINFAEGQSPSSLNDSTRAMMSRIAEFRDDISGALLTTGTGTSYLLATNQGLPSQPNDGQAIAFRVHAANLAAATLAADGGTAYPIQVSPGVGAPAGTLIMGAPYAAIFSAANSSWLLRSIFVSALLPPIGSIIHYIGPSSPNSNFVFPFGQTLSRSVYAALFAITGTTFGAGDGSTTFGIPDLRGRGMFGLDNMGGVAAGRLTVAGSGVDGTILGKVGGSETHVNTLSELATHSHSVSESAHVHGISGLSGSSIFQTGGLAFAFNNASGSTTAPAATGLTVNASGSGTPYSILPPLMVCPYLLRVL